MNNGRVVIVGGGVIGSNGTIAYAYLPEDLREIGTETTIGSGRLLALITAKPLFDPKMTRMKR